MRKNKITLNSIADIMPPAIAQRLCFPGLAIYFCQDLKLAGISKLSFTA